MFTCRKVLGVKIIFKMNLFILLFMNSNSFCFSFVANLQVLG